MRLYDAILTRLAADKLLLELNLEKAINDKTINVDEINKILTELALIELKINKWNDYVGTVQTKTTEG
jgi:hypothetical protein